MPPNVVVLTYYNVFGTGGMETHVQRLVRGLSVRGHRGCVVTPVDPAIGPRVPESIGNFRVAAVGPATEKWFPWPPNTRTPRVLLRYWIRDFRVMLATVDAIREFDPPVLYVLGPVNIPSTATLNVLPFWSFLRRLRRTPVVLGARGAGSHWYERPAVARLFALEEVAQIRLASAVTAVDQYYAEVLFPAKHRRKYKVIPNGVDVSTFSPRRSAEGRNVLFVGRLTRDRGIDTFLDAVERLRGTNCRFRVVGDGPLRSWFLERLRTLSLPVEWIGSVPHSEMPSMYSDSYVVVNPSPVEGIGNLTLEAMACGRCVIRASSEYREFAIKDGVNGMLFARGDPASLAAKIMEALQDPSLVERIGREARATVIRDFSEEVETRAYTELFAILARKA